MTNLLWISYCAPYKQVAHAGGKNHYYWLKVIQEDSSFEIELITCCRESEYGKFVDMEYPFKHHCCIAAESGFNRIGQRLFSIMLAPYSLFGFAGSIAMYKICYIKQQVRQLKKQGYVPDVVLLHWTQIGFLYKWIYRQFPTVRVVIFEEDVSFLRTQREYLASVGLPKLFKFLVHRVMYTKELRMCGAADAIIVTNKKDVVLLKEHGVNTSKVLNTVSYYEDLSDLKPRKDSMKILFYGAMNRKENIDAVVWFAKSVLPRLREKFPFEFVVLGGNPDHEVKKLANDSVCITGFVEDIKSYFEDALCLVVPLFGGAGIKIKVLEGMSSGIPVLTNEIGIEGIIATAGEDYCRCDTEDDYVDTIIQLYENPKLADAIGQNGRACIKQQFNMKENAQRFKTVLCGWD